MMNKPSSTTTSSNSEDEDEKLWQSSGQWLQRMCESGHAPFVSDPIRIAKLLQEGNEKLGLGIEIDMAHIEERLRILDGEMMKSSKFSQAQLFIRRELVMSDICEHQHKLSMPCMQVNEAALTAEEVEMMREGERIPAEVVAPNGRKYGVELRLIKAGKRSNSYAIGTPWNKIKMDNGFREGMVLNIWISRGERGRLCFYLQREA